MRGCEICGKPYTGYYDITVTGIGHFLHHCAEHKEEIHARGRAIDAQRHKDYLERKEWVENYKEVPTVEQ